MYPAIKKPCRGVVFLFTGFASHADKYTHVAEKFAISGYDVVSFDY